MAVAIKTLASKVVVPAIAHGSTVRIARFGRKAPERGVKIITMPCHSSHSRPLAAMPETPSKKAAV